MTKTCRQTVLFRKVRFEEQLCVGILLVHLVVLITIVGIQLVHREVGHQGNVRAVLMVEDEGMLHVSLIAVGLYTYIVEM